MEMILMKRIIARPYRDDGRRIRKINATTITAGGINTPKYGIFWVIDDELLVIADSMDVHEFDLGPSGGLLHKQAWESVKNKYLVEGNPVRYDYFPRGRVMVTPEINDDGDFIHYDCIIYGDPCIIDDTEIRSDIEEQFRLYLSTCFVEYGDNISIDGTHYSCNNCRKH
jgi:hypothetical protein